MLEKMKGIITNLRKNGEVILADIIENMCIYNAVADKQQYYVFKSFIEHLKVNGYHELSIYLTDIFIMDIKELYTAMGTLYQLGVRELTLPKKVNENIAGIIGHIAYIHDSIETRVKLQDNPNYVGTMVRIHFYNESK